MDVAVLLTSTGHTPHQSALQEYISAFCQTKNLSVLKTKQKVLSLFLHEKKIHFKPLSIQWPCCSWLYLGLHYFGKVRWPPILRNFPLFYCTDVLVSCCMSTRPPAVSLASAFPFMAGGSAFNTENALPLRRREGYSKSLNNSVLNQVLRNK